MNIDPSLDAKNAALFALLMPHRSSDVMQRINLWVVAKTGRKLPDYIANGPTLEGKIQLIDELTEIVRKQDWSKLPKVPNGQASSSAALVTAPTPVPPPLPSADVAAQAVPTPAWTSLKPAALPIPAPAPRAPSTPQGDVGQQLAALLARLMPQPQAIAAPAPPVSDDQVRRVVRTELAEVFTKIVADLVK